MLLLGTGDTRWCLTNEPWKSESTRFVPPLLKHLELFQNILDSVSTFGDITIIKVGAYLQRVSLENPTAKKTEEVIFREEVEEEVG